MSAHPYRQIFFCRPPVPGRVKTRLGAFLGMERAALIYRSMLLEIVRPFSLRETILSSQDEHHVSLLSDLLPGYSIHIQKGSDLGERMANAFADAANGNLPVLLTGTDIPDYSPVIATRAAAVLGENDLVLGPARDGGYFLVGVSPRLAASRELLVQLFRGPVWSGPDVFRRQFERAGDLGLSCGEIDPLNDVDTIEDLLAWKLRGNFYVASHFPDIRAVIPVFNESENLEFVLRPLFASGLFREIICADNNSTDGSRELAAELGARVTLCPERGYGATCLTALEDIRSRGGCDAVVFLDGDGADDPIELPRLLGPLLRGEADLVLGARDIEQSQPGAVLPQARFGNWLAVTLIRLFWGQRFRDLGPYRAITWRALESLRMDDRNYGWTIQMQIRALKKSLKIGEIPVRHRRRWAGQSKVTANLRGACNAGRVILWTILRELFFYEKGMEKRRMSKRIRSE